MIVKRRVAAGEPEEQVNAGRIVGGFAWPGLLSPGYCVVLAERTIPDPYINGAHPVYLVYESTLANGQDKDELIRHAVEIGAYYHVSAWYGRGFYDETNARYLTYWNAHCRPFGSPELRVSMAPDSESNEIEQQFDLIKSCLRPEMVALNWTKGTRLNEEIVRMVGFQTKRTCEEFPAAAAVGYALGYLRQNPPKERREIERPIHRTAGGY